MLLRFFRLTAFLLLTLLISQISASADSCPIESFRIGFSPPIVPAEGGTVQFSIIAPANCDWVATVPTSASWIQFASPANGKGTGSLILIIAPNPGTFRSAPVFFNGFPLPPIAQLGSPCQTNPSQRFHQFGFIAGEPNVPEYFGFPTFDFPNGCRMQKSGCALAATATMLTSIGSLSAISNPAWLDGRLKEVLGYDQVQRCSECITTWCDLDFTLIPSATNNAVQMVGNGQMSVGNIDPFLENHLCRNQERVILRLNETVVGSQFDIDNSSHFVFVTRKTTTATGDTDWEVFDPGWGNADQPGRLSSLKGHLQGFFTFDHGEAIFRIFTIGDARVFKVSSTANNRSALSIRAFSPVELFVRDPQGRGLGNFGQGGADIFDVPDGSYFRDFPLVDDDGIGPTVGGAFDGIKTAYIPSPVTGVYRTQATGIGLGSYTLKFRAVQSNGADQEVIISGVTNVGSSSIYEIVYSPDPSSILTVARVATFQSTLDDISNSLQLGFIDNQGIANSLSSKIRKAADAADRGQRSASRDILGAFKNEVLSQASNHVTGIAPQILLADADSLLMQNL